MASLFTSTPLKKPRKRAFNLSNTSYYTTEFGRLTPANILECIPGDVFRGSGKRLVRFSPMLAPAMGNVRVVTHSFFVPERIVNPLFQDFITGYYERLENGEIKFGTRPNLLFHITVSNSSSSDIGFSYVFGPNRNKFLLDHLGLQLGDLSQASAAASIDVPDDFNLSPVLAFWKIYFDYYVNENIGYKLPVTDSAVSTSVVFNYDEFLDAIMCQYYLDGSTVISDGSLAEYLDLYKKGEVTTPVRFTLGAVSTLSLFILPNKGWSKDYFTSALPWPQKGPAVEIPFGNNITASGDVIAPEGGLEAGAYFTQATRQLYPPLAGTTQSDTGVKFKKMPDQIRGRDSYSLSVDQYNSSGSKQYEYNDASNPGMFSYAVFNEGSQTGQIDSSTFQIQGLAATLNDLRTSIKMQEWLEKNARGGSRYIEQILSHFGVRSSDARLQRPEYLGGGVSPVVVQDVLQTSATEENSTPLGEMAGYGVASVITPKFRYFCEEHGFILTFDFIQPAATYTRGIDKMFLRKQFYDYFFPEFAHLGEQPIANKELAAYSLSNVDDSYDPDGTFGYQSRYAEYKHRRSRVHGDFLNSDMKSWIFGLRTITPSNAKLNADLIYIDPKLEQSLNSAFPVIDGQYDHLLVECSNVVHALRPMPKYGVPYF